MTVEIFQGNPEGLVARLQAIIGGAGTINQVLLSHEKGKYIIMWT